MPELPEVETLKRTLEPRIVGARVERVRVLRADVITALHAQASGREQRQGARAIQLLEGDTIVTLRRHGKQLAIIGASGRVMCFHLGMSGQVRIAVDDRGRPRLPPNLHKHMHVKWKLRGKDKRDACATEFWMFFRDPRRFGGIWTAPDFETLVRQRWNALGPDALAITAQRLWAAMGRSLRPIKAALLDQSVLAGVGNIYADEALFRAALHPRRSASGLSRDELAKLARALRFVLRESIRGGGSTLRDHADANGRAGEFASHHAVYGRGGKPCPRCELALRDIVIAQRTTVFCESCQPPNVHI